MSSLYYFLRDETGMCWGIFLRPYIVRHQNGFRKIFLAHCSGSLQFTELRLQLYKFFRKVRLYIVIAKVLVVDHIIDHYQANRQPVSGPHKVLHCVCFFSAAGDKFHSAGKGNASPWVIHLVILVILACCYWQKTELIFIIDMWLLYQSTPVNDNMKIPIF